MILYLETSALVKLLVEEEGSPLVRELWEQADTVTTSVISYPEARAALGAARRAGRLVRSRLTEAKARLASRFVEMAVIDLTPEMARWAGDAAERHALRALDALHLAAASAVAAPELVVATWDGDLARAAAEAGIATAGVPHH